MNTSSTLAVSYSYANGSQGSRLTSMTYPSGQVLYYNYGSSGSLNDVISRLDNLVGTDDASGTLTLQSYKYLGLSMVVEMDQSQDGVNLSYIGSGTGDAGDKYTGLDRFGRIVNQDWTTGTGGTGTLVDGYQYTYDADGNVLSKINTAADNASNTSLDQDYAYDNLNQLTQVTNGTSNVQSFTLDGVGNITSQTNGTSSAVTSTVNAQNELTTDGTATLGFDKDGNTTTDDQGHTLVWNAWNELVTVKNGGTTLASYTYDGEGRLITTTVGATSTDTYFNGQQDIETRTGVTSTSNGTLATVNIFRPDYVNDILLRDTYSSGSFSQRVYFTHDVNYDVTAVISSSGTVLQRQVYTAYGSVTFFDASWTSTSDGYNLTHFWQGGKRDVTTDAMFSMKNYLCQRRIVPPCA